MAGSYGSLGVITAAEIRLVPAKRYVTVTYTPVHSFGEAVTTTDRATKTNNDFVDGIMFSANLGVIVAGTLADKPVGRIRRFRRPHDEWFYLHARRRATLQRPTIESIPITDYLFRYDRGAFWMGTYAFHMFGVAFNRANRLLLNGLLNTRRMYQALQGSNVAQQFIIQDVALPAGSTQAFLEYIDERFGIYPLWLCPLNTDMHSPLHANYLPAREVINVGVWVPFSGNHAAFVAANKELEQKVHSLGGRKWLYAHTYYSRDEFWKIYDERWYRQLRTTYHAGTLPTLYDKVHVSDEPEPVNRTHGIWRAVSTRRAVSVK